MFCACVYHGQSLVSARVELSPSRKKPAPVVPVVYIFYSGGSGVPEYAWRMARESLRRSNSVVFISDVEDSPIRDPRFRLVPLAGLIEGNARLFQFRQAYQPWGMQEPWERQNTERFFVLSEFMRREGLEWVFHADCDVAVLAPVSDLIDRRCDALVSLQKNADSMQWSRTDWVVWAGTSLLSRGVLEGFGEFVIETYQRHLAVLEHKRAHAPFVCDMTHWYLFSGRASPVLASRWGWPENPDLPRVGHEWRVCDILERGFDHKHGHLLGSPPEGGWRSLHFQGEAKAGVDAVLSGLGG